VGFINLDSTYFIMIQEIIHNVNHSSKKWDNYYCPFCNHRKKKLAINNDNHHWHCWTCNTSGRSLTDLYFKMKMHDDKLLQIIKQLDLKVGIKSKKRINEENKIKLPNGFFPIKNNGLDKKLFEKAMIVDYLKTRNIEMLDLQRYNIGLVK